MNLFNYEIRGLIRYPTTDHAASDRVLDQIRFQVMEQVRLFDHDLIQDRVRHPVARQSGDLWWQVGNQLREEEDQ